jgi:hypothetical protein
MTNLHYITQDQTPPTSEPVAVFTAEDRDVWATYRDKLLSLGITYSQQKIGTSGILTERNSLA